MKVLVPNNLNVPELIEELNLSNRRQKYVKEKIYHLISRVVATHKNIKKFDKNGYTGLCSKELNMILNRDYKLILDLLKEKNVIELDVNYLKGVRCNKIKLNDQYQKTDKVLKTIRREHKTAPSKNQLLDSYFNHNLEIQKGYKNHVKHIYDTLCQELTNDNQLLVLKNKIGIWLLTINDIETNQYWYNKSTTNWRYSSTLTNLSKTLKKYLIYEKQSLVQVDLKCSQVTI